MGKKSKKVRKSSHWMAVDPHRFAAAWEPAVKMLFDVAMKVPGPDPLTRAQLEAGKQETVGRLATLLREYFESDDEVLGAATRIIALFLMTYYEKLGDRATDRKIDTSTVMAAAVTPIRSQMFAEAFDVDELKATADRIELQTLMSKGTRKLG